MYSDVRAALGFLKEVLLNNFVVKIIGAVGAYLFFSVWVPNEAWFMIMFIVYLADFGTGMGKTLSINNFSSGRFFRGAIKLGVYGILIVIAHSIDFSLFSGQVFTAGMFIFIITTEASSVLENLHDLGFTTPAPLQKFLKSYASKIRREKLGQFDPTALNASEDYSADFAEMIKVYVPKIRNPELKRMIKVKLENWGIFVNRVQNMEEMDSEIFKAKVNLLLKETLKDIQTCRTKESISKDTIKTFEEKHAARVQSVFDTLDVWNKEGVELTFDSKRKALLKEIALINYQALTETLQYSTTIIQ